MQNARLDESQAGIKIARRNIKNLRYADDTTVMTESEEELKSFLMRVKEQSEKAGLKLIIKKTKMEKEMATHSSILAWKSPWTEEPGRLQSMGLHDWACVHEGGGRWVGSSKPVELKKKRKKKTKILATGPITSWQIEKEKVEAVTDFLFLGSKITADGNYGHEIKTFAP